MRGHHASETEVFAVRRITCQRDQAHDIGDETAAAQILVETLARILRVPLTLLHRCHIAASHGNSCSVPVIGTASPHAPVASVAGPATMTER